MLVLWVKKMFSDFVILRINARIYGFRLLVCVPLFAL